jgi:hypothetical protein
MQQKNSNEVPSEEGREQLHRAPSMLWFVIPFGLLLLYAALSR